MNYGDEKPLKHNDRVVIANEMMMFVSPGHEGDEGLRQVGAGVRTGGWTDSETAAGGQGVWAPRLGPHMGLWRGGVYFVIQGGGLVCVCGDYMATHCGHPYCYLNPDAGAFPVLTKN